MTNLSSSKDTSPKSYFTIGAEETELIYPKTIKKKKQKFLIAGESCFDYVFGYGLACPSTFIITGKAGTGKTTYLLEHMECICWINKKVKAAFLTNEMSVEALSGMCNRLEIKKVKIAHMKNLDNILKVIEEHDYVVIDSLQGVRVPGFEGSSKEPEMVANQLVEAATKFNCAIGIISHLTKDGKVKGNSSIGHIVDCNIALHRASTEWTSWNRGVIVEVDKNRNGPTGFMPIRLEENGFCHRTYLNWDCVGGLLPSIPKNAIVKG